MVRPITFITSALLAGMLGVGSSVSAWTGPTDAAAWTQLTNDLATSKAQLENLMVQADAAGIETNYAYVSWVTIDRFQIYAQYDRDHSGELLDVFTNQWWHTQVPDQNYHINLPFDEMADCLIVSSNAISELQEQLATTIVLQPPVDFSTGVNSFSAGSCLRNGEPVFPSDFTWMPADEDLMQAFGRMGGTYYDIADLDSSGNLKAWAKSSDVDSITDQVAENINFGQYFIGHRSASWMSSAHPEILDGERNFVRYDTDSPLIRGWFTNHWSEYMPAVCGAQGDQPRMHLLANEPNFATRTGGWLAENGVSDNTMNRYNSWLQTKYGTIGNLNATYATAFADFAAAEAAMVMPIDPADSYTLQGGPVWYDWCRFNMDRINDFFQFLKDGTQGYDPLSKHVTIKVLGGQLSDPNRDEGMDMEYLADLMDVTGADCHTAPGGLTWHHNNFDMAWADDYAMEWIHQTMLLDFYKSLHPDKPYFDSEWHGIDRGKWKDFSLDPDYIRSAIWMGFTHGMNMIQAWVWGRENDGSFQGVNSSFIGEVLTQPLALDAYGRILKELNAHAQAITDLANEKRDFLLYYCEDSAIQDLDYIPDLEDVYEALKLLNLRVGFTTPSSISTVDPASQTVVVSPTAFISNGSYSNLVAFTQAGGNVVLVNGAAVSFGKDEWGFSAPANSNLVPYASVSVDAVPVLAGTLDSALTPLKPVLPVQVEVSGTGSSYGVLTKQTRDPVSDKSTVTLINLSNEPRTVSLSLASGNVAGLTDLITGNVATNIHSMQPYDILLLEVEDAGPAPYVETVVQWGEINGDENIVSASVDFAFKTMTYMMNSNANPVVGASYYPVNSGRAPLFNHAASSAFNAKEVMELAGGDILHSGKNSAAYDAMYVWENYLPAGSALDSLAAEVRLSMYSGTGTGTVHWIVQKESGDWFASAGTPLAQYHAGSSSFTLLGEIDPATLNWFEFAPIVSGYGSIGPAATIDMSDVKSVGLYYDLSGSGQNIYADLRYFKAVASSGSATGWDAFVLDYGLSGIATSDFDLDGESDLQEYALGGNPTNPSVQGTRPYMSYHADNHVSFYNLEVTNLNPGIRYESEWTTNLVTGPWTNLWNLETNYPAGDPEFNEARHRVWGGDKDALFFRLNISQP